MWIFFMIFLILFLSRIFFKFIFLVSALRTNSPGFLPLLEFFSVKSAREVSLTLSTRSHPFTPVIWQALWGFKLQAILKHFEKLVGTFFLL
jgi:hypothetical protein